MQFCLPKKQAEKFIKALDSKDLDIVKLFNAEDSAARRKMFSEIVGAENAKPLNALFESKMDAVQLEEAMEGFIKESIGISETSKRNMLTTVKKLQQHKYLTQADLKLYREDFINQRLGIDVSIEEAQQINKLAKTVTKTQETYGEGLNDATAQLKGFIDSAGLSKGEKELMMKTVDMLPQRGFGGINLSLLKKLGKETEIKKLIETDYKARIDMGDAMLDMEDYAWTLAKGKQGLAAEIASVLNIPRAAMATWDLSAPGRQGWGLIATKEWWTSWKPMLESTVSPKKYREFMADIMTDPLYKLSQSGRDNAKLKISDIGKDISTKEETFATTHLDRFIGVQESQRAYTIFLNKARFDTFKRLIRTADLSGEDVSPNSKALEDIIMTVNAFSGAGELKFLRGKTGPILNASIWSPRKFQGTVQMFNLSKIFTLSPTARKEHIKNLLGMIGTTGTLLSLAGAMGAQIEWDPRSSDFGKIRIGDTRFDIFGGNASYVTLWARLAIFGANSASALVGGDMIMPEFKSTTSGKLTELNKMEQYKPFTAGDIVWTYGRNKLSPMASFIADWIYGENTVGEKFELLPGILRDADNPWEIGALGERFIPLIAQDIIEAIGEDPTTAIFIGAGNFVGIGSQTYSDKKKDKKKKDAKDLFK